MRKKIQFPFSYRIHRHWNNTLTRVKKGSKFNLCQRLPHGEVVLWVDGDKWFHCLLGYSQPLNTVVVSVATKCKTSWKERRQLLQVDFIGLMPSLIKLRKNTRHTLLLPHHFCECVSFFFLVLRSQQTRIQCQSDWFDILRASTVFDIWSSPQRQPDTTRPDHISLFNELFVTSKSMNWRRRRWLFIIVVYVLGLCTLRVNGKGQPKPIWATSRTETSEWGIGIGNTSNMCEQIQFWLSSNPTRSRMGGYECVSENVLWWSESKFCHLFHSELPRTTFDVREVAIYFRQPFQRSSSSPVIGIAEISASVSIRNSCPGLSN